jgi:hypothetical protein
MKYKWLIIFMVLLAFSCGNAKLPKGILPKDKMVAILVDQHLAEVIFNQRFAIGVKDENAMENLYLSILKKYKVDEKVFEESTFYYSKHPNLYKPIYDEVLNRLNEMQVKVKQEDPALKKGEDKKLKN